MLKNASIRFVRYAVQIAFLVLTLFIGYRFSQFVLHFGSPGHPFVERPASVDAFLPIGGLMALKYVLLTGIVDPVHPSGLVMFVAVLAVSLFIKKGFCGWICPIGTVSQFFWMAGEKIFGRNFRITGFTDLSLRSAKYILLGLFIVAIGVMPLWSMVLFFIGDYYKTVDVRMMLFFAEMGTATLWFLIALGVLSLFFKNVWCRYLCPYGALAGLLSRWSPLKVRRNESNCAHCGACTKHCPAGIDVESGGVVSSAECFGCLTCVSRCPSPGALELTVRTRGTRRPVSPWAFPLLLVVLFYLVIGIGMLTGNWHSKVPYEEYQRVIPDVLHEYSAGRQGPALPLQSTPHG